MRRERMIERLRDVRACGPAKRWVEATPGSPSHLWRTCQRGDWMLWLAARAGVDCGIIVLAACDVARTVLGRIPEGEHRPRIAIETAERWACGEATIEQVRGAAAGANVAANAACANAACAYAAANAAAVAVAAVADVHVYAYAAVTTAARASAAAVYYVDVAMQRDHLRMSAAIVRRWIPWGMVADALEEGECLEEGE